MLSNSLRVDRHALQHMGGDHLTADVDNFNAAGLTNPRKASLEDVIRLYEQAYRQGWPEDDEEAA